MNNLMIREEESTEDCEFLPVTREMKTRIRKLASEVREWEADMSARSHAFLYRMLQNCYGLYLELTDMNDPYVVDKKQALNGLLEEQGIKNCAAKPLTYKIVRCVFGEMDRRRLSAYHRALNYIQRQQWELGELPGLIEQAGGLTKLADKTQPAGTAKQKSGLFVWPESDAPALASVTSANLSSVFDADRVGEKFAAILTLQRDGTYTLHCVVPSPNAVAATLQAFNKANAKRPGAVGIA